jgi:hypothetical protein
VALGSVFIAIREDVFGATVKRTGSLGLEVSAFCANPCGAPINIVPISAATGA